MYIYIYLFIDIISSMLSIPNIFLDYISNIYIYNTVFLDLSQW